MYPGAAVIRGGKCREQCTADSLIQLQVISLIVMTLLQSPNIFMLAANVSLHDVSATNVY